jgi:hypothetical protein
MAFIAGPVSAAESTASTLYIFFTEPAQLFYRDCCRLLRVRCPLPSPQPYSARAVSGCRRARPQAGNPPSLWNFIKDSCVRARCRVHRCTPDHRRGPAHGWSMVQCTAVDASTASCGLLRVQACTACLQSPPGPWLIRGGRWLESHAASSSLVVRAEACTGCLQVVYRARGLPILQPFRGGRRLCVHRVTACAQLVHATERTSCTRYRAYKLYTLQGVQVCRV